MCSFLLAELVCARLQEFGPHNQLLIKIKLRFIKVFFNEFDPFEWVFHYKFITFSFAWFNRKFVFVVVEFD